jgi:putative transposase
MQKPTFENGSFYHIYNRGVEKRKIFLDDSYYQKFLNDIWDFNDVNPAPDNRIHRDRNSVEREKLVEIYAYVLMPNHYHLLVRQVTDGGIEKFMRKIGIGYAMYFNAREDRVGSLFQGRFKAKLVEDDAQIFQLTKYIHLNPLKIYQPGYQELGLKNKEDAISFLENYHWSSYRHFAQAKSDPIIDGDITEFVTLGAGGVEDYILGEIESIHLQSS